MQISKYSSNIDHASFCVYVEPTRTIPDLAEDVLNGILIPPRSLPPKYFYDEIGSQLFDQICMTPEYYPTRVEDALLADYSSDIIADTLPDQIVELGSGSSRKTRRLLDACEQLTHTCQYAPFDVCEPMLRQTAMDLISEYDWLDVMPLLGDYHAGLGNLPASAGVRLFVFLGSTIGNFTPEEAVAFINELRLIMQPGDYFLLGADRVKDVDILNAAYNDSDGITAEFNLNVLRVLNRELDANFETENFHHQALFNEHHNRIEMYLVSREDHDVSMNHINKTISLNSGEKILTELSHKYHFNELETLLEANGFNIIRHFEPENKYFSLVLAQLT